MWEFGKEADLRISLNRSVIWDSDVRSGRRFEYGRWSDSIIYTLKHHCIMQYGLYLRMQFLINEYWFFIYRSMVTLWVFKPCSVNFVNFNKCKLSRAQSLISLENLHSDTKLIRKLWHKINRMPRLLHNLEKKMCILYAEGRQEVIGLYLIIDACNCKSVSVQWFHKRTDSLLATKSRIFSWWQLYSSVWHYWICFLQPLDGLVSKKPLKAF